MSFDVVVRALTNDGKLDFGANVEISFVSGNFKTSMVVPFYLFEDEGDLINFAGEEDFSFEITKNAKDPKTPFILFIQSNHSKYQPIIKSETHLTFEQTTSLLGQLEELANGTEFEFNSKPFLKGERE